MKASENELVEASQMFRNGEIRNALQLYIKLSNKYYDTPELTKQQYNQLAGIQATIGIIYITLGNYEEAAENLQKVLALNQLYELDSLILIRSLANLITIDIIKAKFDDALEKFNIIKNIIMNTQQSSSLIKMIYRIFFRVENLDEISEILEIAKMRKITLIEAVSLSSLIWSHNICEGNDQNALQMQQICYKIFLQNQRFDYAISAVRHILRYLQNQEAKETKIMHYQKQLKKIMSTGIAQDCQIENQQVILTIQTIYQDLKQLSKASSEIEAQHKYQNIYDLLWKKAILYVLKKHTQHQTSSLQDENIMKTYDMILNEKNELLIKQIKKTDFLDVAFKQYCFAIDKTYSNIDRKIHEKNRINSHYFLIQMRMFNDYKQRVSLSPTPSRNKVFKNRQNLPQYGISITNKQSHSGNSKYISPLKSKDITCSEFNTKRTYLQKKKTKMLRFCQHGAFLNKRNFNSDGGQYKFVKITSTQIKWAKNPDKIDSHCQSYELKDVRSIVYGKVTPILNKIENKMLKPHLCFSLLLQKRTLDFYCNTYEQVENWICGLTVALHKLNVPIVGYTPGKLLWRKALMKLKTNFVQPLKPHQRNCFFLDNAYAVVQFGKNNYKLPSN